MWKMKNTLFLDLATVTSLYALVTDPSALAILDMYGFSSFFLFDAVDEKYKFCIK